MLLFPCIAWLFKAPSGPLLSPVTLLGIWTLYTPAECLCHNEVLKEMRGGNMSGSDVA
jgi:hypothetical protein